VWRPAAMISHNGLLTRPASVEHPTPAGSPAWRTP
jgi:hypothetical protein